MTDPAGQQAVVDLACRLASVRSDALHREGRLECLEMVRRAVGDPAGVEWSAVEEEGHPSLLALPEGSRCPELLILTHVDVVCHDGGDIPAPRVEGDRLIGPGVGDMKAIVAACAQVFRRLHEERPGCSLGLAVTTDEETGGSFGAKRLVERHGLRAGVVLVPDGGGPSALSVAEKGILHLRLHAEGRETHAARPWLGENAVEKLMEQCRVIKEAVEGPSGREDHWKATCCITGFGTANRSINLLPSNAEAAMDIRFPPPDTADDMLRMIRGRLRDGITIRHTVSDDPGELNPDPLYQRLMEAITGSSVQHVRNEGGSDARFFARLGIPVNMSRPRVGNIHAVDEWIDIPSLMEFTELYERYIRERCPAGA